MDAGKEVRAIKFRRKIMRRKKYSKSKLMPYRKELAELRQEGASYPDLVVWLRTKKRKRACHTTIMRYLKQLPEVSDG